MKSQFLVVITTAFFLSACVSTSTSTSEAEMLDKAESATGVRVSELSIIQGSVFTTADAVNYRVQDRRGNEYKCYFTSSPLAGWGLVPLPTRTVKSDAICTKLGSSGSNDRRSNNPSCNALLKAAGRC